MVTRYRMLMVRPVALSFSQFSVDGIPTITKQYYRKTMMVARYKTFMIMSVVPLS